MLQRWADVRDNFSAEKPWHKIIWNNKDIRINNRAVFYETFFESGFAYATDLLFDLNTRDS